LERANRDIVTHEAPKPSGRETNEFVGLADADAEGASAGGPKGGQKYGEKEKVRGFLSGWGVVKSRKADKSMGRKKKCGGFCPGGAW
jgi:hypothetical protein